MLTTWTLPLCSTDKANQDAAVAVAAGLNMTEPGSTGIGGDMFCLFYEAKTKKVHALNGSGRAPSDSSVEKVRSALNIEDGEAGAIPMLSALAVTVPGASAGWCDVVQKFGSGKLSMEQILTPAIELGEDGFPVSEIMGYSVRQYAFLRGEITNKPDSGREAKK